MRQDAKNRPGDLREVIQRKEEEEKPFSFHPISFLGVTRKKDFFLLAAEMLLEGEERKGSCSVFFFLPNWVVCMLY